MDWQEFTLGLILTTYLMYYSMVFLKRNQKWISGGFGVAAVVILGVLWHEHTPKVSNTHRFEIVPGNGTEAFYVLDQEGAEVYLVRMTGSGDGYRSKKVKLPPLPEGP